MVANSKAWKPFSYLDERGEPQGILIELWREYGRRNGVSVEFRLTDWNESLELVKRGEADAHAGLLWSEPREAFLDYSDPFFDIEAHLFFSQDLIGIKAEDYISSGTGRVGVVAGGFEQHFAEQKLPTLKLVAFDNNRQLMDAAINGQINAFIADLQVANFYLYVSHDPSHFVPVKHLYTHAVHPAVAEGNKVMQVRLNEGFARLTEADRDQVLQRWMHIETVYPKWLVPLMVSGISVVVIMYILSLQRLVKIRTSELEVANANLALMATTDPLTGVHNRRYFVDELEQFKPACRQITVMVFDIDDFKKINDSFGHAVGDEVIKVVAEGISGSLPEGTLFARVGGEEFAAVFKGEEFSAADELGRDICQKVEKISVPALPEGYLVTVSTGVAWYDYINRVPELSDADQLMYRAKSQGKNQSVSQKM